MIVIKIKTWKDMPAGENPVVYGSYKRSHKLLNR